MTGDHTSGEVKALLAPVLNTSAEKITSYVVIAEMDDAGELALMSDSCDHETIRMMLHMIDHLVLAMGEDADA